MSDTSRTPTPWYIDGDHIIDAEDNEIVTVAYSDFDDDTVNSNAAHIVKCVNLHEELVDALKAVLNGYCESELLNDEKETMTDACKIAREALKKAGSL